MIDFGYHIVAGTVLVIDAIQSPNFSTGVSGWIIRQDGSVEFANATIRGQFVTTGANKSSITIGTTGGTGFGTAFMSLRPPDLPLLTTTAIQAATIDALSDQPAGAGIVASSILSLEVLGPYWANGVGAADVRRPVMVLKNPSFDGTVRPSVYIGGSNAASVPNTFDITLDGNVTVNGQLKGLRTCTLQATVAAMASGTAANLLSPVALQDDYNMFNGVDTVTIPVTGFYTIGMLNTFSAQAVAAGYRAAQFSINGGTSRRAKLPTSASVNSEILSVPLITRPQQFFAGDTIQFFAHQNSGAALNLTADLWVDQVRAS